MESTNANALFAAIQERADALIEQSRIMAAELAQANVVATDDLTALRLNGSGTIIEVGFSDLSGISPGELSNSFRKVHQKASELVFEPEQGRGAHRNDIRVAINPTPEDEDFPLPMVPVNASSARYAPPGPPVFDPTTDVLTQIRQRRLDRTARRPDYGVWGDVDSEVQQRLNAITQAGTAVYQQSSDLVGRASSSYVEVTVDVKSHLKSIRFLAAAPRLDATALAQDVAQQVSAAITDVNTKFSKAFQSAIDGNRN